MYSMNNEQLWSEINNGQQQQQQEEDRVSHHEYKDHSNDNVMGTMNARDLMLFAPIGMNQLFPQWNGRPNGPPPFPVKLYSVLEEIHRDPKLCSIVSWQPHGRCFVVHKVKEFVQHILPSWFRQTKFASFQRQLNLYGFKRITSGRDRGGYYHELFLRQKEFLCHRIPRIRFKGTGVRKPSSPETEPNFYIMPLLPQFDPVAGGTGRGNVRNRNGEVGGVGGGMILIDPLSPPSYNHSGIIDHGHSPKVVTPQLLPRSNPGHFVVPSPPTTVTNNVLGGTKRSTSLDDKESNIVPPGTDNTAASSPLPISDQESDPDCWYQPFHPVANVPSSYSSAFSTLPPPVQLPVAEACVEQPMSSHRCGTSYRHSLMATASTLEEVGSSHPLISATPVSDEDNEIGVASSRMILPTTDRVDDILDSLYNAMAQPLNVAAQPCPHESIGSRSTESASYRSFACSSPIIHDEIATRTQQF